MKKFDNLASKQAKLDGNKKELVKKTMEKIDSDTLTNIFNVVKQYGHPNEQKVSKEIEQKYFSGKELGFNDLVCLDSLYKSNFEKFSKKDEDNE